MIPLLLLLLGCSRPGCESAEVYDHSSESCLPYSAAEPVASESWTPSQGTSWQWQLTGPIRTVRNVAMYDVDLLEVSDADWASLEGKVRICYFSAGSLESFRDDVGFIDKRAMGKKLKGWADERWLDVTHPDAFTLVQRRLDQAVERGCDGVEPDNVDGYTNKTGFPLTAAEQLQFNRFIADEAHLRGLSVGLKNDLEQLTALEPWFDWALNEECVAYEECGAYNAWLSSGKAVFHTEYVDEKSDTKSAARDVCRARPAAFSTLVKTWDLGPEFTACD